MKKLITTSLVFMCAVANILGQSTAPKFSLTEGFFIQHYSGNLGNSFFQFKTVCFGGGNINLGYQLNPSFQVDLGFSMGDFGYVATKADIERIEALEAECPTCGEALDMDQLRSRMVAGNVALRYQFSNGYLLKSESPLKPYAYLGFGLNNLRDNMRRHCVNEGNHWSINSGFGLAYRFGTNYQLGYNVGFGCFPFQKVYNTDEELIASIEEEEAYIKLTKQKDWYLQNMLFVGVTF